MDDTQILNKLQRLVKKQSAFDYGSYAFHLIINEPVDDKEVFDIRRWVITQSEPNGRI